MTNESPIERGETTYTEEGLVKIYPTWLMEARVKYAGSDEEYVFCCVHSLCCGGNLLSPLAMPTALLAEHKLGLPLLFSSIWALLDVFKLRRRLKCRIAE
jgi:hypothetical protein